MQITGGSNLQQVDAHTYEGMTDVNGQASLTLSQPGGAGVKTHITAKMRSNFNGYRCQRRDFYRDHQPGQRQSADVGPYARHCCIRQSVQTPSAGG